MRIILFSLLAASILHAADIEARVRHGYAN